MKVQTFHGVHRCNQDLFILWKKDQIVSVKLPHREMKGNKIEMRLFVWILVWALNLSPRTTDIHKRMMTFFSFAAMEKKVRVNCIVSFNTFFHYHETYNTCMHAYNMLSDYSFEPKLYLRKYHNRRKKERKETVKNWKPVFRVAWGKSSQIY